LRIESIVYRELSSGSNNQQRAEDNTIVARTLRDSTITASTSTTTYTPNKNNGSPNQDLIPVSRNGFLSRGSLRSPIVASPQHSSRGGKLTFDHLQVELETIKHDIPSAQQQNKDQHQHQHQHQSQSQQQQYEPRKETRNEFQMPPESKSFPRIIALNENMGVVSGIVVVGGRSSLSNTARTMVLEDVSIQDHDDDDGNTNGNGKLLDFERPFYNDCDRVLSPLPSVHPTCNSIHELSLTTPDIDSALLSMKGSWRSVWKVDLDHRNQKRKRNSNHTESLGNNETSSFSPVNATKITESNKEMEESSFSSVVLKMLHLHRQYDRHSYEAHSTDIMVMDRLTASPYVVDAYGFCGQSVVTEFAASTGRDYVKRYDIGSRERMRIARDLARGLADVQALQPMPHDTIVTNSTQRGSYDDTPSIPVVFAHNDINIANTIMVNDRIKWNDFNIGVFMRKERSNQPNTVFDSSKGRHQRPPSGRSNIKNDESNIAESGNFPSATTISSSFTAFTDDNRDKIRQLCPAPVIYRSDMWRSPEEIKNISYVQVTQTDIYGLANIFYQTMTRHQPWTYKEPGGALTKTDIANRKLKGTIPTIPEQYLNTTKLELQTLFAATNLCFFPTPEKRPTARRLAFGLGSLYDKLKHKERFTRRQILDYLIPPES
jgi:hypothetical protein